MKHSNNRGIRNVLRYLRVMYRRYLKRDGIVLAGLVGVLTLCMGISLTASAVNMPDEVSAGEIKYVKEARFETPQSNNLKLERSIESLKAVQEKVRFGAEDAVSVLEMIGTTSSTTTTTCTSTSTTTTTTVALTTSTEETRPETTEIEETTSEPVAWEEEFEEENESESVGGSIYDYVSESDIVMLAKTVAQEGGDCSYTQQACVIWTVLNRVDSPEWPNTISENLLKPNQFAYYSNKVYREDHYQVAYDQVYNWLFDGERYLSGEYQYFYGDGHRNHFYGKNTGEYVPD